MKDMKTESKDVELSTYLMREKALEKKCVAFFLKLSLKILLIKYKIILCTFDLLALGEKYIAITWIQRNICKENSLNEENTPCSSILGF